MDDVIERCQIWNRISDKKTISTY